MLFLTQWKVLSFDLKASIHFDSEHPWMDKMHRNLLTTFFFFSFSFFLFFFFFFFLLHALFQWVVSYSILIHIIFVVSCELRIGMYWEFSVCRNLLCVSIFFVKLVAPESKHQSVLLTRFMSLLGLFSFGAKLNHAVYLPILGSFGIVDNAQLIELQL